MYPSTDHAHLIERVSESVRPTRTWTLRDDNRHHYHGVVEAVEAPIIRLCWRASAGAPARVVGTYRLHLSELLRAQYVRPDPVTGPGHKLRIRFCRKESIIYLQVKTHMPALPVGQVG